MLDRLKQGFLAYHHRTSRIPQGERVVASLTRHLGQVNSLLDVGCGDGGHAGRGPGRGGDADIGVDVHVRPTAMIEVQPYDGVHLRTRTDRSRR